MATRHFTTTTVVGTSLLSLLVQGAVATATTSSRQCSALLPNPLYQPSETGVGVCSLPITETAGPDPLGWSPWTHPPQCVVARKTGMIDKKFCIYTNSRHGGRGYSIVTTPETAADSAGILDMDVQATHLVGGEEDTSGAPYKLVDVPGKGKGMVATRRIAKYEQIMVDFASLVVDVSFASLVPAWTGYQLLRLATARLSDPGSVLELDKSNSDALDPIENVLRTNAFSTYLSGEAHMAVYPVVSRINHACMPNAYTRFVPSSLTVSVAASKEIEPGEEITISYIPVGQTSEDRKQALGRWGFNCTCSLCSASRQEIEASDARRRLLYSLRDQAFSAFQQGKAYQALRLTKQVINMIPIEELFPLYSEQYENLARLYWSLGDHEKARENAKKSLDVLVEQGYLDSFKPEYLEMMWKNFEGR